MPSDSASKADVAWPRMAVGCRECLHVLVSEGSSVCKHKCIKWHQVTRSSMHDPSRWERGTWQKSLKTHIRKGYVHVRSMWRIDFAWVWLNASAPCWPQLLAYTILHSVFSYVHQARSLSTHRQLYCKFASLISMISGRNWTLQSLCRTPREVP